MKIEKRLEENNLQQEQLQQEIQQLQNQLKLISLGSSSSGNLTSSETISLTLPSSMGDSKVKYEVHESLCKELKMKLSTSQYRDWDTEFVYTSNDLDVIMGTVSTSEKYEQIAAEWQANKMREIQSTLFPSEEVIIIIF